MPRYRIEFECEESEVDTVVADGRWRLQEIQPTEMKSKHVASLRVIDPDTKLPVEMEIRKLENGAMIGLDGSWLEQIDDHPFSPYDAETVIVIPDDEYNLIRVTASPYPDDEYLPWEYKCDGFLRWYWEVFQEAEDGAPKMSVDEAIADLRAKGYKLETI